MCNDGALFFLILVLSYVALGEIPAACIFAVFRFSLVILVLFASQKRLSNCVLSCMTSLPTLPPDAGLDICLLWRSTINRLLSCRKQLPSVAQLFDILHKGPICAFDVLSGVCADDVRYPPGWLPWRLRKFPVIFEVSDLFQAAFQASLQEKPPFLDIDKLHGLCSGLLLSQQDSRTSANGGGVQRPLSVASGLRESGVVFGGDSGSFDVSACGVDSPSGSAALQVHSGDPGLGCCSVHLSCSSSALSCPTHSSSTVCTTLRCSLSHPESQIVSGQPCRIPCSRPASFEPLFESLAHAAAAFRSATSQQVDFLPNDATVQLCRFELSQSSDMSDLVAARHDHGDDFSPSPGSINIYSDADDLVAFHQRAYSVYQSCSEQLDADDCQHTQLLSPTQPFYVQGDSYSPGCGSSTIQSPSTPPANLALSSQCGGLQIDAGSGVLPSFTSSGSLPAGITSAGTGNDALGVSSMPLVCSDFTCVGACPAADAEISAPLWSCMGECFQQRLPLSIRCPLCGRLIVALGSAAIVAFDDHLTPFLRTCACGVRSAFVFSSRTSFSMVVDLVNFVEALLLICVVLFYRLCLLSSLFLCVIVLECVGLLIAWCASFFDVLHRHSFCPWVCISLLLFHIVVACAASLHSASFTCSVIWLGLLDVHVSVSYWCFQCWICNASCFFFWCLELYVA